MYVDKLKVAGLERPDAELQFQRGLNVISGPSETGKSYILSLVDFMLTAKARPESIDQARGYTTVQLEASGFDGSTFCLIRNLDDGEITMFPTTIAKASDQTGTKLRQQFQAKWTGTASEFLLTKMGISPAKLRTSTSNDTQALSIRQVAEAALVSETRIISKTPPLIGDDFNQATLYRAFFEYLLSGRDASNLEKIESYGNRVVGWNAKTKLYDEIITEITTSIQEKESNRVTSSEEDADFAQRIANIRQQLLHSDANIRNTLAERSNLVDRQQEVESRIIFLGELLVRFGILRDQYNSDWDRLQFITEGRYYFSHLEPTLCPFCERPISEHEYHRLCGYKDDEVTMIKDSAFAEAAKIKAHLADLESTIFNVSTEIESRRIELSQIEMAKRELEVGLQNNLQPESARWTDSLDSLLLQRELAAELSSERKRLEIIADARKRLGGEKPKHNKPSSSFIGDISDDQKQFAASIREVLVGWGYPVQGEITFDRELDVVINGKARRTNGKGVRALIHAAYSIGLLRYCLKADKPHAGFVVLDSPIHNMSEPDETDTDGAEDLEETVKQSIKYNFYRYLAKSCSNDQIIVLENDDPDSEVASELNFIQFTHDEKRGRYGFFPISK